MKWQAGGHAFPNCYKIQNKFIIIPIMKKDWAYNIEKGFKNSYPLILFGRSSKQSVKNRNKII